MSIELIFFFFIAASAVISALLMITRRNPIISVLFLIVNFFCLAVLYLVLHAQFIAIIQILVYAGAIMVLFLFVIMLLNLGDEKSLTEKRDYKKYIALALSVAALVEILIGIWLPLGFSSSMNSSRSVEIGTVEFIGKVLYTDYLLPFEITSILLLAALVGVIVLAKKKFEQ